MKASGQTVQVRDLLDELGYVGARGDLNMVVRIGDLEDLPVDTVIQPDGRRRTVDESLVDWSASSLTPDEVLDVARIDVSSTEVVLDLGDALKSHWAAYSTLLRFVQDQSEETRNGQSTARARSALSCLESAGLES